MLPTAYTQDALASFVVDELGGVATQLAWVPETPQVARAVFAALRAYGVSDIADATDAGRLETLARLAAWQRAVAATAGNYTVGVEGMSFNREQVHAQAKGMLLEAERSAAALGVGPLAMVTAAYSRFDGGYAYQAEPEWGF